MPLPRSAAALLAGLAIAASPCAQTEQVRVEEVFAPPAADAAGALDARDAAAVDALLVRLRAQLDARTPEPVLDATRQLLSMLDAGDSRWPELVYLRAAAFEQQFNDEQVLALSREYLRAAPEGPRAGWFHGRLAEQAMRREAWGDAADAWQRAFAATAGTPARQDLLSSLEAFGRAARPREARRAAEPLAAMDLSPAERLIADFWLLDALLIADDPAAPVPGEASDSASVQLRRALLFDVRGERPPAVQLYRSLAERDGELAAPERALLRDRLAANRP